MYEEGTAMSRCVLMVIAAVILTAAGWPAAATTLHVPSQYATIHAGLNAAVAGDTVEVACGNYVYSPDIYMKSGVVLRSETGEPECVVLSPQNGVRIFLCIGVVETTVIEGFTFTGARDCSAMWCEDQAAPVIRRCIFRENRSYFSGCAGAVTSSDSSPVFDHCLFEDNSAWTGPAGALFVESSDVTAQYCTFLENGNTCVEAAGSIIRFQNVTFVTSYGTCLVATNADVTLGNCVFAFGGYPVYCYGSPPVLSCCDIFGNSAGNWVGCIGDQYGIRGNISADPQFCDLAAGDLTLQCTSPCAPFTPPNPECDLIGAWPVGCGGTAVQGSTWGGIKGMFRK